MTCEHISKKALSLDINKFDINIVKQPFNGFVIEKLTDSKDKEIKELIRYISNNEYKSKKKPLREKKVLTKKLLL